MNAFTPVSKEQFFRFIQSRRDEHYEYEGGLIVQQMAGRTRRHNEIAARIMRAWVDQLPRADWVVLNERGIETADRVRFADVVVEPADEPDESLASTRPIIIVEVLSPSSGAYDLKIKPPEYVSIPTLDADLVASQTEPAVRLWQRAPDGTFAADPVEIEGLDQIVMLRCRALTVKLDLGMIYDGLYRPSSG